MLKSSSSKWSARKGKMVEMELALATRECRVCHTSINRPSYSTSIGVRLNRNLLSQHRVAFGCERLTCPTERSRTRVTRDVTRFVVVGWVGRIVSRPVSEEAPRRAQQLGGWLMLTLLGHCVSSLLLRFLTRRCDSSRGDLVMRRTATHILPLCAIALLAHVCVYVSVTAATGAHSLSHTGGVPGRPTSLRGSRPNIVFFLGDDLGFGEVQAFGPDGNSTITPHGTIPTPHANRLAREGMKFTEAYAGAPVCAASRCNLMTGVHSGHAQVRGNRKYSGGDWPLNLNASTAQVTLPALLQSAGYHTAMIGKWGLGGINTTGAPLHNGWNQYYGQISQSAAHNLYPPFLWLNDKKDVNELNDPNQDNPPSRKKCMNHPHQCQYMQDLCINKTVEWVGAFGDSAAAAREQGMAPQPFFLYLSFVLPHAGGWAKSEESGAPVPSDGTWASKIGNWPNVEVDHASTVENQVDRYLGLVLDLLKQHNLDNDTLLVFASDNGAHNEGGHDYRFFNSSGPYRGFKRSLYEGGVRSPTIVRWPGIVPPGSESDVVTAFYDFLPTFAELAGVDVPAEQHTDGVSITSAFQGQPIPEPHQFLYNEFCTVSNGTAGFGQSVRAGRWKLVRLHEEDEWELFDLKQDIGEEQNVAGDHPDIVLQLSSIAQEQHVEDPIWPTIDCHASFAAAEQHELQAATLADVLANAPSEWFLHDDIDSNPADESSFRGETLVIRDHDDAEVQA